jgi:hypothetical protein
MFYMIRKLRKKKKSDRQDRYIIVFRHFFNPSPCLLRGASSWLSRLLGGLVLGDLVAVAGV